MKSKNHNLKLITGYVAIITIFFVLSIYLYRSIIIINKYYLFVVIPFLFLSVSISLFNLLKLLLTILLLVFGRNDNDEIIKSIDIMIYNINQLYKYTLIGIFLSLLTVIMILDILLCVNYEKFTLLGISIVIWILLYYSTLSIVVKIVKKQIKF